MTRNFRMIGGLVVVVAVFTTVVPMASATFTSSSYPYTASATGKGDVFDILGSTVSCTENSFKVEAVGGGEITAAAEKVKIQPSYKGCTAFGLPATVNMTGCYYVLRSSSEAPYALSLDIDCFQSFETTDITVYNSSAHSTVFCHVTVPPQTLKTGAIGSNTLGDVVVSGSIGSLTVRQSRTSIFCPAGTHTGSATYTIQPPGIALNGSNGTFSVD